MPSFNDIYRFGEFELRVRARMLSHQGIGIPLPSKTYEVLLYLVANSGRVVTKDELLKGVWPDSFVEEGNLTQHVFRLRKALQIQPDSPPCIVTVPGLGYQFSVMVEQGVESSALPAMPPAAIQAPEEVAEETPQRPPALLGPAPARLDGGPSPSCSSL